MKKIITTSLILLSTSSMAKDLSSSASSLRGQVDKIGPIFIGIFLALAALYVSSGSQEGTRKYTWGLIGGILFFTAGAVVSVLQSLK